MTLLRRSIACLGLLAAALAVPSAALADVQVGDKPVLKFQAFDTKPSKTIDLNDFRGKIVVVDFWATWCPPCMAEAGHMVAINSQYTDKGVQMIGISLDANAAQLKAGIKDKGFVWPMSFEGKAWKGATPRAWGVDAIPQTFIIGPDGTVLWRGFPNVLDRELADAVKKHPPVLVDPAIVTAANARLDAVESALSASDNAKALKLMGAIPESAKLDPATADRMKAAVEKLADFGKTQLTAAEGMITAKKVGPASIELTNLARIFAGTPTGDDAKAKLDSIAKDPEARKTIAAAKLTDKAAADLKLADKAKADKNDDKAYPMYQRVAVTYPGTPASEEASLDAQAYEADAAFITKFNADSKSKKAATALLMADSDRDNGAKDKAKELYQRIVTDYPNTPSADKARAALAAIGN